MARYPFMLWVQGERDAEIIPLNLKAPGSSALELLVLREDALEPTVSTRSKPGGSRAGCGRLASAAFSSWTSGAPDRRPKGLRIGMMMGELR